METKKFYVMTTEQKEMLEEILKALEIGLDDCLSVSNMNEIVETINRNEKVVASFQENLIQLNNRLADLESRYQQQEAENVLGVLGQNED